jgi:diacylglycerol kinase (ATP)
MDKNTKPKTGIKRIIFAFFYSMQGFLFAIKKESAFRQEFLLSLLLTPVAWFFSESVLEFLLLLAALLFVMLVELINSSLEKLTDLVQPQFHPLAKAVKDMASAAVFLALCIATLVWVALLVF